MIGMNGSKICATDRTRQGRAVLVRACMAAALAILPMRALAQFNETVLQSFANLPKGANPNAPVTLDAAGNLYGTTPNGGDGMTGGGTVYRIDTRGRQTVLHTFAGANDGRHPYSGVILDSAGNLYGTTKFGGTAGYG